MDLARVELIRTSTVENLKNNYYLEDLIIKLGFNTEMLKTMEVVY